MVERMASGNLHPSPQMKTLRSGSVSENLPAKFSSTVS